MRTPSVAPCRRGRMDQAPVYETGSRRFESCRRRQLVVAQWRERRPPKAGTHVRIVPTRPPSRDLEATRLDEEPVPNTGRGCTLGRSSRPASATFHAAMVQRSRHRALNPEIGVRFPAAVRSCSSNHPHNYESVPGSRAARHPAVTRKAGVRAPPWQHIARWPRIEAHGCKPCHGGESPSRASIAPPHHRTHHVVVVQRRGSRPATPGMRVRIPPATPSRPATPPCRRGPEGKDARLVSEKQRVRSPPPAPRTDPEVSKL